MLGVSRLKMPVTVESPGINKPYTRRELELSGIHPETLKPLQPADAGSGKASFPKFTDYEDLRRKETVVIVCVSGGGARAARMAAHSMAHLEAKYNSQYPELARSLPLASRIDAWSTVSGGSVYASFLGVQLLDHHARTNTFRSVATGTQQRWGTKDLGAMSSMYYFWPFNFGYAPLMQLTTEWDTLDLFAHNLALFHEGMFPILPASRMRRLGDLPPEPRFFFNATCRETYRPFIFTQTVLHRDLSGDPLARLDQDPLQRWITGETNAAGSMDEPFRHASTLEDLGSPPQRFPLAYAAMASAAFPGVFEPLPLSRYGIRNGSGSRSGAGEYSSLGSPVSLVDGGLYDNTGLVTALQWIDYLRREGRGPKRFVVLEIDAKNDTETYLRTTNSSGFPIRVGLPFRGAMSAVETVTKMYRNQQGLVKAAIRRRIAQLESEKVLEFYNVHLRDSAVAQSKPNGGPLIPALSTLTDKASDKTWSEIDRLNLFGPVHKIPTDFVLSRREDADLRSAVIDLLDSPAPLQPGDSTLANRFLKAIASKPERELDSIR